MTNPSPVELPAGASPEVAAVCLEIHQLIAGRHLGNARVAFVVVADPTEGELASIARLAVDAMPRATVYGTGRIGEEVRTAIDAGTERLLRALFPPDAPPLTVDDVLVAGAVIDRILTIAQTEHPLGHYGPRGVKALTDARAALASSVHYAQQAQA